MESTKEFQALISYIKSSQAKARFKQGEVQTNADGDRYRYDSWIYTAKKDARMSPVLLRLWSKAMVSIGLEIFQTKTGWINNHYIEVSNNKHGTYTGFSLGMLILI